MQMIYLVARNTININSLLCWQHYSTSAIGNIYRTQVQIYWHGEMFASQLHSHIHFMIEMDDTA